MNHRYQLIVKTEVLILICYRKWPFLIPLSYKIDGKIWFLEKYSNQFVCFDGKHCVKIDFRVFQSLITLKKISQRKTIFDQHKKYGLFLEIVFH